MMKKPYMLLLAGLVAGATFVPVSADEGAVQVPADMSESAMIAKIRELFVPMPDPSPLKPMRLTDSAKKLELLSYCNAYLQRFPKGEHMDEVLIAKLNTLGKLAFFKPEYLKALKDLTGDIPKMNPEGELASENAYFGIEAHVLDTRVRGAKPQKELLETYFKRYEKFIENYPDSKRRPFIYASYIRNSILAWEAERAKRLLREMEKQYPDHESTSYARGAMNRLRALGEVFDFRLKATNGDIFRSLDHLGDVLVIHFWTSASEKATRRLKYLKELDNEYGPKGMELVGICLDEDPKTFQETVEKNGMLWPQYLVTDGASSKELLESGVITIPTYFVLDREGILRSADPRGGLSKLVSELLDRLSREQRRQYIQTFKFDDKEQDGDE